MKLGTLFLALATSVYITDAVLPPGYEDQIWCPIGDCQIFTNPFGLTGALSSFYFCFNVDSGNITDGVWTGSSTDVILPEGWVEPEDCTAEEYSECFVDEDCAPTVRNLTPVDGCKNLCTCFSNSTYHPFDQCEGRANSSCVEAMCPGDPCKGYKALCASGLDRAGACTISSNTSRSEYNDDDERTKKPTRRPTRKPTRRPTRKPTRRPTRKPSPAPSRFVTPAPTDEPETPAPFPGSTRPTRRPTRKPSPKPTQFVTPSPTDEPATPSPTDEPVTLSPTDELVTPAPVPGSTRPTRTPTTQPSPAPTHLVTPTPTVKPVTPSPTDEPVTPAPVPGSTRPTRTPTRQPSPAPTHLITLSPTVAPVTPSPTDKPVTPAPVPGSPPSRSPSGRPTTPIPVHISMPMEDHVANDKKKGNLHSSDKAADASQTSMDNEYYDDFEETDEVGGAAVIGISGKTPLNAIA